MGPTVASPSVKLQFSPGKSLNLGGCIPDCIPMCPCLCVCGGVLAAYHSLLLLPEPLCPLPSTLLLGKPLVTAGGRAGCPDHCVTPVAGGR